MFRELALCQSDQQRANAQNVSLFTLYTGQFMFSTQMFTLTYLLYFPTDAVSLETYPLYSSYLDDFDLDVIWWGEIRYLSLLGVKGQRPWHKAQRPQVEEQNKMKIYITVWNSRKKIKNQQQRQFTVSASRTPQECVEKGKSWNVTEIA